MTIGDPKKAKLLGIVAIGAVGFMVIELVPGPGDEPAKPALRTEERSVATSIRGGQWHLVRDPFSSALLVKRRPEPASGVPPVTPGSADPASPLPATGLALSPFDIGSLPPSGTKELVGTNRAKVSGNETVLTLQATLKIDDEVAMISLGRDDAKEFREGSQPMKGVRVASIDSDGVVLACKGGNVHLAVGQAVKI